MSPRNWFKPCSDIVPLTLTRSSTGQWEVLEDAEYLLDTIRNHRPEMRFRLVYDGELRSSKGDHKTNNVWTVRKELQPQLAELWTFKPALLGHAESEVALRLTEGGVTFYEVDDQRGTPLDRNRRRLVEPIEAKGHRFLPIVRSSLYLTCTVDILFLRKDHPGEGIVRSQGDLDNRIQTLFDGLRMPGKGDNDVVPSDLTPDPFAVLLEDDKLITSVAIRTDRLLHRPNATNDSVVLVIDVIVSPSRVQSDLNSGFTWD